MIILRLVVILLVLLFSMQTSAAEAPLSYSAFPIHDLFSGRPAQVNLSSHKQAKKYRTVLREGAKSGPNFAGRFTVVTWGCGTACQELAILDAKNGSVYFPSSIVFNSYAAIHDDSKPFQYQLDSNLLIVSGDPDEEGIIGTFYYKWTGQDLKLMRIIEKNFEPHGQSCERTKAFFGFMANWGIWDIIGLISPILLLVYIFPRKAIDNFNIDARLSPHPQFQKVIEIELRNHTKDTIYVLSEGFTFKNLVRPSQHAAKNAATDVYEIKFEGRQQGFLTDIDTIVRSNQTIKTFIPVDPTQTDKDINDALSRRAVGQLRLKIQKISFRLHPFTKMKVPV